MFGAKQRCFYRFNYHGGLPLPACNLAALSHHSCRKWLHYLVCTQTIKTRATQILRVSVQRSTASPGKLSSWCPRRGMLLAPVKLHNDQSTVIVAWIYHGTTLASLGSLTLAFSKALNPSLQFQLPFSELSHWRVSAKTGRDRALMLLFQERLLNAWDWASPPSSMCHIGLEVPLQKVCWGNHRACLALDGGNIRRFMSDILRVAEMGTCCIFRHIAVSQLVWDYLLYECVGIKTHNRIFWCIYHSISGNNRFHHICLQCEYNVEIEAIRWLHVNCHWSTHATWQSSNVISLLFSFCCPWLSANPSLIP